MHLHFDAPPQVRAGLNMVYTALLSTVYYAVKTVVDPTILPNAGLARPLHVTAPEGTVLNCVHPAAVNGRAQHLPARRRSDPRRAGAGGAGAGDRGLQRRLRFRTFIGAQPATAASGSIWKRSAAAPARAPPRTGWTACTST